MALYVHRCREEDHSVRHLGLSLRGTTPRCDRIALGRPLFVFRSRLLYMLTQDLEGEQFCKLRGMADLCAGHTFPRLIYHSEFLYDS